MYKLIIVDDEERIREGLINFINWDKMGFDVVADFEDGREAIEYIKNYKVDVVLTDIRMAEVSGLKLAKYIFENCPTTKVVIISGHKEFEYAKKAIEYNVEHYLIKPTNIEETQSVFEKIRIKLDQEKAQSQTIKMDKGLYEELLPILKEQFFADLYMGALRNKDEITKRAKLIGMDDDLIASLKCCLLQFLVKDLNDYISEKWEYGKDRVYLALKNIFLDSSKNIQYYIVFNKNNEIKVLAVSSDFKELKLFTEALLANTKSIKETILPILQLNLSVNLLKSFDNLFELSLFIQPLEDTMGTGRYELAIEKYKLILTNMNTGSYYEVESLFDNFIEEIKHLSNNEIHDFIIDLMSVISRKFLEVGIDLNRIAAGRFDYKAMGQITDLNELKKKSRSILVEITKIIQERKEDSVQFIVKKSQEYIDQNYGNDISLEDVSNHVFLSNVYFSRIFKQRTGETFTDYLIKIRINKAIELLSERNLKIYEISEKVGYRSSKYFNRQFKEYTGYTPKEYCRRSLGEVSKE